MYELINMYVLMHVFLIGISLYTFLKLGKDIVTVREAQLFKLLIGTCCLYMVTAAVWSLDAVETIINLLRNSCHCSFLRFNRFLIE